MSLIDGLSGFFKENSKKAVDAAVETATVAKIKADIKAEEVKMTGTYTEIGKLFCKYYDDKEIAEVFLPLMQKINDSKSKIANLEAEIDKVKKTVTCPECGSKSPEGAKFCGSCGNELPVEEVENEAEETAEKSEEASVVEILDEAVRTVGEAVEEFADEVASTVEEFAATVEEAVFGSKEESEEASESCECEESCECADEDKKTE